MVFRIDFEISRTAEDETKIKHYYVQESVGIATGFLLAALTLSGVATLTDTPSAMGFLSNILDRPKNERPFVVIAIGYPPQTRPCPISQKKHR